MTYSASTPSCTRSPVSQPSPYVCACLSSFLSTTHHPCSLWTTGSTLHHIEHSTSSPHFPRSNGFIECQVQTLKQCSAQARIHTNPLDFQLTLIGPNMPSPHEILYNRIFQCPGKPSQPVDMESVRNYLLSCRQSQKTYFNKAHDLIELGLGQEVLFRSPVEDKYIPGPLSYELPCYTVTS